MPIQDSSSFDDNVVTAIIREMMKKEEGEYIWPFLAAGGPVPWDTDDEANLPNLRVKCRATALIPGYPVYQLQINLEWTGKAKGAELRALKKQVQDFCEDTQLGEMLSDAYCAIETNAEDIAYEARIESRVRNYAATFNLRGYRLQ